MMKAHARRSVAAYPYFKLAVWDERSFTWKDGKVAFETEGDAHAAASSRRGRYRVSRVEETGRVDLVPFQH